MSGRSNRPIQGHHDGESDELEDQSRRLAASVETSLGRHPAQSTDDDSTHHPHRGKKSRSKKHIKRSRESDDSDSDEDEDVAPSPPRRGRKSRSKKHIKRSRESDDSDEDVAPSPPRRGRKSRSKKHIKRSRDSDDEEDDEGVDLGRVEKIVDDERVNIQKTMQSIASWMEVNRPPVTAERFRELAPIPTQDADYTQKDFNNVLREWNEDPMRNLILGRHTAANVTLPGAVPPKEPRRGERESFASLYRIFPRHYDCLYEEFMGPIYRLTYDNSENRHVYLEDGSTIPDPFPSKGFSETLKQIVLHDIWRGKLAVIAACLQYVNMLRTNDRRPWQLPDGLSESLFFKTWNNVIQDRRGSGERVDSLYGRVKTITGSDPGLYGDFFDQMTESFQIKAKPQSDNASKRTKDDDPYFIRTTDLTILLHAIDNYGYGGTTHYHRAQRVAALKHWSKTGNDYPSVKQFGEARDLGVLSARLLARKEENRKARLGASQAVDPRLKSSSSMSSSALPPPKPTERDREAEYNPTSHDDEGQHGDGDDSS
ncbi:hypothetical protein F5Y13DRAFT_189798 [Hypoxylon sp. FL1857]|nr:hypothetical protein F5Y13DRAFT_189798 [Hypoxylon sp. FL1857]